MSDAQSQRNVPKRQIARLIGSSEFPIWVLSEDSHLVFANEAFETLFPELGPDPLGLRCTHDADDSSCQRSALARWLALPSNGSCSWIRCVRDTLPPRHNPYPATLAQAPLLRWIMPLDHSEHPCCLCVLKPDRGDAESLLEGDFHQRIEVPAIAIWKSDESLDGIWFLQGQSLSSQRMRQQIRLATLGEHPLLLVGPPGNYLVALAGMIFKKRRASKDLPAPNVAPFTIDCSLMDKDLLQSTLEWIDDTRRKNVVPEVILHRLELLPKELREPLARISRQQTWNFLSTCAPDSQELLVAGGDHWEWLIASCKVQEIQIEPLSRRTDEIESLLFAWMRRSSGVRWTSSFLDALLAYSWPGDIDEMDRAMEHALAACTDSVLEERHLPISLRTFPSHIERSEQPEAIDLDQVLLRLERTLIERALTNHPKNNTAAAKSLGISRARLLRRMQQWGMGGEKSPTKESDEIIFEEIDPSDAAEGL